MSPLRFIGRVLTGRFTAEDVMTSGRAHLVVGLLFTWLAGIGRYWDNPRASVAQNLGLDSVIYVFALAAFLWLLLMPMLPERWSYFRLVTIIAAGAALRDSGRRFMTLHDARTVNVWFLAVVATWRRRAVRAIPLARRGVSRASISAASSSHGDVHPFRRSQTPPEETASSLPFREPLVDGWTSARSRQSRPRACPCSL